MLLLPAGAAPGGRKGGNHPGKYYIHQNYIYGPEDSGHYYIEDGYIYGPSKDVPWARD